MAAAAMLDFIKVPFLRRGWADSHQISCAFSRHYWRRKKFSVYLEICFV